MVLELQAQVLYGGLIWVEPLREGSRFMTYVRDLAPSMNTVRGTVGLYGIRLPLRSKSSQRGPSGDDCPSASC